SFGVGKTGKLYFVRCQCADAQGMYAAAHQVTRRVVDQAMPGDGVLAGKGGGDDVELVVPAILGPGMAGVAMRFVLDGDGLRLQDSQALAQQVDGCVAQAGKAFLNGLTLTFSYTPAAT